MHDIQNRSLLYENTADKPLPILPKAEVIPRGIYPARLVDIQKFSNAWGERLAFVFEVSGGEQAGKRVVSSTATALTKRSKLGQTVAALMGRELTDAEALYGCDPKRLIGTDCRVVLGMAATRAGKPYTTVENILK
jgi:hypothetical protein